jgi:hypothetical protein
VGRPKLDDARTRVMTVRMLKAEMAAFKKAADQSGVPLSIWVRQTLRKAVGLGTLAD